MQTVARPKPAEITERFGQKSDFVGLAEVAGTWAGIVLTVFIAAYVNSPWLIPLAVFLIAGFQHRFFTIYHDAFHATLTKDPQLGHFLAKYFAAYPSLSRYEGARQRHLDHHSHAASANDPDRVSHCRSWKELLPLMFPIPFGAIRAVFKKAPFDAELRRIVESRGKDDYPLLRAERPVIALMAVLILGGFAGLSWAAGGNPAWALLYHLTLIFVMTPLVLIRQWVEHYVADEESISPVYFHVRSNRIERFILSPMNFNFHGAHHYYPWISYYKLPALHAYLRERGVPIQERPSYVRMIARLPWSAH